ncbi:hypothetical protein MAA_11197 [Metarhizium robertsii ARSEF 23]|uniref:Uncharacterized protein n=1 Tax=Metarhizium robertsii (strain ARSEF 23 / ATCC MYA-3075) TaxID=655844 RepID=A0A0B2XGL3_METRA|nr:uncharacterized protein MAA_11197 [Metarhizium robertsii ARSEF 23]KHO11119.1 hypothetical protein MAA_11197 [Metarhizium robertsii ARSEF 23]
MSSPASGQPPNQLSVSTRSTDYSHPQIEAGLPGNTERFPHAARRLARWLVRKWNELLVIALIGIPLGQLFLESQLKQKSEVVSFEWLCNLVLITWIAWVCVVIVLALHNFQYLAKNKLDIIRAAVAFCSAPLVDHFTTGKFADSSAVFPICLVLAVICPEIYRLWSPSAQSENERQD